MNLEDKFHLLSNCEDELICFVCEDWCKDPVRLGKCGHYFCSICLPNYDYSCPKCKELFFKEDVSTAHWYGEVRQSVEYFKTILEPLLENLEKLKNTDKDENTQADLPFRIKFADPKSFKKNAKGESNLHLACKRKNIQQVKRLIEDNVDINSKDYACWTPLHEAIQAESIDIVIQLLNSGALINSVGEFYVTPLHKAVLMENSAIISILLENGASKDEIDFYGRKPEDCTKRQDLLEALNEGKPKENIEKPHVFLMNKVMVYCHSIDEEYRKKIVSSKNIRICKDFNIKNQQLTHLIVKKSHKVSQKILLSMLKGLIILRQEWTDDIIKGTVKLLSEPVLENNIELSNGIKKATINHLMNKPKLFDGIKFYLEGPDDAININGLSITKDFLKLLISTGDGINLCRAPAPRTVEDFKTFPFHATTQSGVFGCSNIIIFNDNHPPKLQYKMQQLQHKSTKWLIDCIMNFTLT